MNLVVLRSQLAVLRLEMRVPKNTNGRSLTEGKASSLIPSLDPCLLGSIQIGESASNTSFPTPYPGIFKDSSSAHLFEGRTTAWDHLGISEDFGNTIRQFTTDNQEAPEIQSPQEYTQVVRPNPPKHEHPHEKIPSWDNISHSSWSSPFSSDLSNLHFDPIIHEIVNLIEAKAVSLAPPDFFYDPAAAAMADLSERVVEARKRTLVRSTHDLAIWYSKVGRQQEALQLVERVVEAYKRTLGEEHPETVASVLTLIDFVKM
ncbi:MAG: hypothetical protein L6R40_008324 [Gallowayella cf. fulva]|nr:MAG: hypothetical protein L6R40_008324 [Xanthomendoza cf. fulva]